MESSFELPDEVPSVLKEVAETACRACINEIKGRMSGLSWKVFYDKSWPAWTLQLAPQPGELVGGEDDGEQIFDHLDIDLLALMQSVDKVESFAFDPGAPHIEEGPHVRLVGAQEKCLVVVEIYLYPFPDDETGWIFDTNAGEWREPQDKEPGE